MTADDIEPWMIWGYYISPMMYGQNAIVMNEFLDKRWNAVRSLRGLLVFISRFFISCKYFHAYANLCLDYRHLLNFQI